MKKAVLLFFALVNWLAFCQDEYYFFYSDNEKSDYLFVEYLDKQKRIKRVDIILDDKNVAEAHLINFYLNENEFRYIDGNNYLDYRKKYVKHYLDPISNILSESEISTPFLSLKLETSVYSLFDVLKGFWNIGYKSEKAFHILDSLQQVSFRFRSDMKHLEIQQVQYFLDQFQNRKILLQIFGKDIAIAEDIIFEIGLCNQFWKNKLQENNLKDSIYTRRVNQISSLKKQQKNIFANNTDFRFIKHLKDCKVTVINAFEESFKRDALDRYLLKLEQENNLEVEIFYSW